MSDQPNGERLVGADRVLAVLVELGNHPNGITLEEMAAILDSPKPTVHRALASLRKAKLAGRTGRGVYVLGDEFYRLAFKSHAARPETERIEPLLRRLAETYGETAHYAVLDGAEVVYRSKVDPPVGAVKLTSTIGGRNPAYRTAVGKLLLGYEVANKSELRARLGRSRLEQKTPTTLTDIDELWSDIETSMAQGYSVDNQENEAGVNCVAVPVFVEPAGRPTGALSVSALTFRCPLDKLVDAVPAIQRSVAEVFGSTPA